MEIDRTKFLAAVFVATFLMAVAAGAVVMLDSKPKASTTSINVHNVGTWVPGMEGSMGLEKVFPLPNGYYPAFQLDIEHRYYGRIYARAGEKPTYLVLNFTIYVDEINGNFAVMAQPRVDFVLNATEIGLGPPMLEISTYWEPFSFKAEVDKLPACCTLDSKYIICDMNGYSYQEGPSIEHDPASLVLIMSFEAAGTTWRVRDPKVDLTNLLVFTDSTMPLYLHGPMVSIHVDEKVMSYADFWAWAEELHYPVD